MTVSHSTKPVTSGIRVNQKLAYLGLLMSGIAMGLWPVWPLAWIALVPLWWVIHRGTSLRQSALCALVWGVGYHGAMLEWVLHLHPMMWLGIPWLGSIAISLFAYAFVTLWGAGIAIAWAIAMAALNRVAALGPWKRVFVGTALWCGIEALWSVGPLYWSSLAITQSPGNLVILHLARLSGHLTITAAIVAVNGLLATSRLSCRRWLMAAVGLFAIAHLIGWGLYRQPLQDQSENALRIGIIQGNIPSREKLTYKGVRQAEDLYRRNYESLARQGADAVLTPEAAIPTVWNTKNNLFREVVQNTGIPLWLGTFTTVPQHPGHIHQSLLEVTPNSTQEYHKIKLVPLGEYIPLQSIFGDIISQLSPIGTDLLPGAANQHFETALGQAAVGICYDSAYGWIFRKQVLQGGQFILTASNNDPYPQRMMRQHHGQDVIQAISTDRWAVRSTNTGLSAVVIPHGQTQRQLEPETYDTQIATIYRRSTRTLYIQWGNWLVPLLLAISVGVVLQSRRLPDSSH